MLSAQGFSGWGVTSVYLIIVLVVRESCCSRCALNVPLLNCSTANVEKAFEEAVLL